MAFYEIDRFAPVLLIPGVAYTRSLDVRSGASSVSVDTGGTYTLYKSDGTVATTAATVGGNASITVPADMPIGAGGYEVWSVTVDTGTVLEPVRRQVLVTTASLAYSPVTNQGVTVGHEGWDTYPTGFTSWQVQIRIGWYRIIRWLMSQSEMSTGSELHTPDLLYRAAESAIRAEVARYMATLGNEAAMDWSRHYEHALRDELNKLVTRFDTDSDGIADGPMQRVAIDTPGFPMAGPLWGRR
jgi:hypothetical protein